MGVCFRGFFSSGKDGIFYEPDKIKVHNSKTDIHNSLFNKNNENNSKYYIIIHL